VTENSQKQLLLDISEEVGNWHDHGMLGFALHPQFEQNGYFYVLYAVDRHHLLKYGTPAYNPADNEYFNATIGRLTRYTATKTAAGYHVDKSSRKILLGETKSTGIPILSITHGVGTLLFGTDGTLLVSCGEGAGFTTADTGGGNINGSYAGQGLADGIITQQEDIGAFRAQMLEAQSGKILRIDPETGNGIPGNPFYEAARPGSVRSKTYALGLRNPFRMALKPGTGSTDKAAANPGVLYVGDVGWATWEELNIVTGPGMNFGWPLFEGLDASSTADYQAASIYNPYAPNPQYGVNGCTQEYFYFRDLIRQATANGNAAFSNPCNHSLAIPADVKTFMHSRPVIDWKHYESVARTGIFNGETAAVAGIGAAGSPVTGPQFGGSASVGGVFF
jgi:glucose/arabinose dehydrogenase